MNYQSFTNDSLTVMYEAIRGAVQTKGEQTPGLGSPIPRP
jgi:hypothetical protein